MKNEVTMNHQNSQGQIQQAKAALRQRLIRERDTFPEQKEQTPKLLYLPPTKHNRHLMYADI